LLRKRVDTTRKEQESTCRMCETCSICLRMLTNFYVNNWYSELIYRSPSCCWGVLNNW